MPKRKTAATAIRAVPDVNSTPSERVAWLLETVWEGNRSQMALAVGCTHSVLTKIAAGQQSPGRRLLTAIASHPKVNPAWLLSGQGEPLLAERADAPAEGWPVPIAQYLLPGPPDQFRDLLSGEHFPVAGGFYRPTRYWLEIQRGEPLLRAVDERFEAGDLLLLETDESWRRQVQMVDGRLCVVRMSKQGKVEDKLARVQYFPGDPEDVPHLIADCFETHMASAPQIEEIGVRKHPGGKLEAFCRPVPLAQDEHPRVRRARILTVAEHLIDLANILAVCLLMNRR